MPVLFHRVCSVGLLLSGLLVCPSLRAAPTASDLRDARRLFAQAEQDEKQGRWADAALKLHQVLAIKETAGVRFHLANCQEHANEFLKARANYERARALAEETKVDDVLTMVADKLEALDARMPSLFVSFPLPLQSRDTVEISLDGVAVEVKPPSWSIPLDPGRHRLLVRVNGDLLLDKSFDAREGRSEPIVLPRREGDSPSIRPVPVSISQRPPREERSSAWAWGAFGTAGALAVGGYLAYRHAGSVADESSRVCAQSLSCDPKRASVVRGWDAAAAGMWLGAVGAAGLGLALTLSATGKDRQAAAALRVGPGNLELEGSF